MGIFDKVKGIINPNNMDENYNDDEYIFDGTDDQNYGYDQNNNNNYQDGQQTAQQPEYNVPQRPQNTGYSQGMSVSGSALELKVIKPRQWEDVNKIADHLISHRTVVLNLEETNKETARRMIDFLLGVVYSIEGDIKKVANNTWVITPSNVDLSQDQQISGQSRHSGDAYGNL